MNILGLSFNYHDAAAAIIQDGIVVAAAQEERFSRKKNDPSFPASAITFCLDQAGIRPEQLDHVVNYENPLLKFDRILNASMLNFPRSIGYLNSTLKNWSFKGKFEVQDKIARFLNISQRKIHFIKHHQSHAGAAFFCSPFNEAAILTVDGVGEYETATISIGEDRSIKKLVSVSLPHSIGLFYSAFTAFLGFEVNEGEYKVMGMSGFGRPTFQDQFMKWFNLHEDGSFTIEQKYFQFLCPETLPYTEALVELLGPPRDPESPFRVKVQDDSDEEKEIVRQSRLYADIASSVQKCTEDVLLHMAEKAQKRTGSKNLCMAGGVALNSLANNRLKKELGCRLFVHPAAGDAGGAVGAALFYNHCILGNPRKLRFTNVYLGKSYSEQRVCDATKGYPANKISSYENEDELVDKVALLLHQGSVIGWMQDRFEWGPRALGARSILANPTRPDMQGIVNEKIKFREQFRPFAPSVLMEKASDYFDFGEVHSESDPEYFMLSVCKVLPDKLDTVPAITHVDGTARIHLVNREAAPLYHKLITTFEKYSGVPVVLNTSFNLRGDPIVNTPEDALWMFEWCDMDYLVIGNCLLEKET